MADAAHVHKVQVDRAAHFVHARARKDRQIRSLRPVYGPDYQLSVKVAADFGTIYIYLNVIPFPGIDLHRYARPKRLLFAVASTFDLSPRVAPAANIPPEEVVIVADMEHYQEALSPARLARSYLICVIGPVRMNGRLPAVGGGACLRGNILFRLPDSEVLRPA